MRKATVTYHAADGENPVVETRGQRFFDGQPVDLNTRDHGELIAKADGNPHFDVEYGEEVPDEPKRKPGRPKTKIDPVPLPDLADDTTVSTNVENQN